MRILTLNLLAAAVLLFGATSASAFAINMIPRGATSSLTTSSTVTVDVFLDADQGMTIFSIGVLNSNSGALLYDGPASAALPPYPTSVGPSGAEPSYILYAAGKPTTYMIPLQSPYWLNFPSPAPVEQVNINFLETGVNTTTATGLNIYVATLVFHVVADFSVETLSLAFTSSNIITQGTTTLADQNDFSIVTLSAPVVLTGHVPEPTTAMLIGLGIVGLGLAGRRRA